MSRYTGPSWKVSRRLGISLSGTGKELARRPYAPGQHGQNNRRKLSEYGLQLREKQKLRMTYGLSERQFANLFVKAGKIREGKHGDNFMILLERRLDNVVYRLGLATTRRQARQLVNHGHITVDGKRVDIPSYEVKPGQVIPCVNVQRTFKSLRMLWKPLSVVHHSFHSTKTRWKAHWYVFLNVKNSMQTSMKLLSLNTTTNFNLQSEFVETVLFMGVCFFVVPNYLLHVTL